jgi:hypothetical protein
MAATFGKTARRWNPETLSKVRRCQGQPIKAVRKSFNPRDRDIIRDDGPYSIGYT